MSFVAINQTLAQLSVVHPFSYPPKGDLESRLDSTVMRLLIGVSNEDRVTGRAAFGLRCDGGHG